QFVEWFDGSHISRSPSRFDFDKLRWLNAHYLKAKADDDLALLVRPRLEAVGVSVASNAADLAVVCGLLKERAQTLNELAGQARMFYVDPVLAQEDRQRHIADGPAALPAAIETFASKLESVDWSREAIAAALKA